MKRKQNIIKAYRLMGIDKRAIATFMILDKKYGSHKATATMIENRKRLIEFWIKGLPDPKKGDSING